MRKIVSDRNKTITDKTKKIVGYLLVGYPNNKSFFDVLDCCTKSDLDILELGFPSKNPYSDGEVIAKAHLSVDHEKACSIEYWTQIREKTNKPIWLMAYYNDFIGTEIYKQFAKKQIIDAIVIPDTTFERRQELAKELAPFKVDVIGFVNPGMNDSDMDKVFTEGGLVYEQLYVGQTGSCSGNDSFLPMIEKSLKYPQVSAFAGFGINSVDHVVSKFKCGFDGAIIGTAILKHLNESIDSMNNYLNEIGRAKKIWH